MSESGKSVRPVRQLSLQPPAPRRQLIRRQRSAEEEKSLQICVSSLARGKRGTSAKPTFERPKLRVAWKENRGKNEKELEQVEVVARQIPGRSKPITGRSRGFAIDKPSILYSREELAERLRLAWKHRQENKANINIFLAHGTLEERCDSEMSSHATITAPSSPILKDNGPKLKTTLSEDCKEVQDESFRVPRTCTQAGNYCEDKKEIRNELSSNFERCSFDEMEQIEINEVSGGWKKTGQEKSDAQKETLNEILPDTNIDECLPNSKKKSINIECSNPRVPSKALPSIKIENVPLEVEKVSKEDFSSAKQKRASFHSGTNRAFLDPIKSPTIEFRCNSSSEKDRTTIETKDKTAAIKNISERTQKAIADGKPKEIMVDKCGRTKMFAESKESSTDNKTTTQRTNDANKCNLTIRRATTNTIVEDKDSFVVDKIVSRNVEVRCSSVNERNAPSKKMEIQKVEQKPRRTSSAPPQRLVESNLSNNRVQVNIVIDTQSNRASGRSRDQEKTEIDCKNNAIERADAKVSSGRSVRSAPLKRRSRSAKRRFWGGGKNDEEGKSRNRSSGRAKSSIDSKTIDIVTMVSLVSSADSDSDIENSPRDDKLINELRNKLPTTSIIKTSMNPLSSARKPIKSVSFQKDSFDEDSPKEQQPSPKEEKKPPQPRLAIVNHRGNGGVLSSNDETVSWRTEIPDLTVPVLSLIHDAEETLDVPLTDREKRCLAVPIGDLHDKKRKLLKTRSISSRSEMERQTILSKTKIQDSPKIVPQKVDVPAQVKTCSNNISANVKSIFISPSKETVQPVQPMSTEPRFQTNKEKECWHLYRKMCDKGVCVSFDTVLRGMLTPTEYRLRQKELSQDL